MLDQVAEFWRLFAVASVFFVLCLAVGLRLTFGDAEREW